MQVSATVFNVSPVVANIKAAKFFILSAFILTVGMLCGALSVKSLGDGSLDFVNDCFKEYLVFRSESSIFKIFLASFISGLFYIFSIAVSSFGLSGFAVTPLLLFLRGFSTCAVAGVLYRNYSLQGIAFANLILLPSAIVVDFILIYVANEGLNLTSQFYSVIKDVSFKGIEVRPHCVKLLRSVIICILALVAASCVEAAFSAGFIKYFNFI